MQKVVSKAQCWQMGRAPLGVQVGGGGGSFSGSFTKDTKYFIYLNLGKSLLGSPPPSAHLGLFWRAKSSIFIPASAGKIFTRVNITVCLAIQ